MKKPHIKWWRGHWEIYFERDGWPYVATFSGTIRTMLDYWPKLRMPT